MSGICSRGCSGSGMSHPSEDSNQLQPQIAMAIGVLEVKGLSMMSIKIKYLSCGVPISVGVY